MQHNLKLTNGGLAKLLVCNLIGNVGPHQHAHGDTELLLDHIRDELQPVRSLVHTLVERKQNTGRVFILSNTKLVFRSKSEQQLKDFHQDLD